MNGQDLKSTAQHGVRLIKCGIHFGFKTLQVYFYWHINVYWSYTTDTEHASRITEITDQSFKVLNNKNHRLWLLKYKSLLELNTFEI